MTLNTEITIRRMDLLDSDAEALLGLAELDSHAPLAGPILGAEVGGRVVAAIEIESGRAIADPFTRTSELRALLELRGSQLRGEAGGRRRRRARVFGRRVRPAVGGSPAGQIITLPRVN